MEIWVGGYVCMDAEMLGMGRSDSIDIIIIRRCAEKTFLINLTP